MREPINFERIFTFTVFTICAAVLLFAHPEPAQSTYTPRDIGSFKLAGDQATGANVTPVTLTGLVFTYEKDSTYLIEGKMIINSAAATTGCGFQFDVSSTVTTIACSFCHQLANTGTQSGGSSIADDASVGVSSGVPTLGVNVPVDLNAVIVTGANTGTAQLRFRSETTAITTCKAGSTIKVTKVLP